MPQDFAFTSFDKIIWASYITPHLTTVNYPMREMARLATTLLLNQIHGTDNQVQHIVLPATLIVCESCGAWSMSTGAHISHDSAAGRADSARNSHDSVS